MGRSLPTITDHFRKVQKDFKPLRHVIFYHRRLAFDRMFVYMHKHLTSSGIAAYYFPIQLFLLSVMLEQQRKIEIVKKEQQQIREEIAVLEKILEARYNKNIDEILEGNQG